MFFMFAAEAVAKLFESYTRERESKRFARHFFLAICTDEHRRRLVAALGSAFPHVGASPAAITEHLYRIRCDVVHRWNYYGMSLRDEAVRELRAIVLEGAAHAARTLVPTIAASCARKSTDQKT